MKNKLKVWHFSDSHSYHGLLTVPKDIDVVIFSGDCSNPRSPYSNEPEVRDFIEWFSRLDIKYKVFVAGNHDSSIESGLVTREDFGAYNIIYLENEDVTIEGFKIWGSPYTPNFGDWCFMKHRSKLDKLWQTMPVDTNIVVVHTPPKGILDLAYDRAHNLEYCGCSALKKRVMNLPNLNLVCFGHIHNNKDIINAGTMMLSTQDTIFSNGSVVTDGRFGQLSSNGNIFEL
jgi:Icc-related predicted phosphoesterase